MKRVFFFRILIFLALLFSPVCPVLASPEVESVWWNQDWQARARVEIENQTGGELPLGYTVSLAFDHASWVQTGQSLVNGDDLRIVYQPEEGEPVELDRVLKEGFSWNDSETTILFQTQGAVPDQGFVDDYFLYFDNPGAGSPLADPGKVFAFFEDFEDLELPPFPQYQWCSGGWCRTDQFVFPEVSEEESFSGSKSLKLTGPGSPAAVYIDIPFKDYTLGARVYTVDPATEIGLYFRGWEFSALYPLFAFFWSGYQLDTGRGLSLGNSCRSPDCPFPQPGEWNHLEVTVVGKEILAAKFNGNPIWWLNQPETLALADDQGSRVGFLYLFPWGENPQPLYYDDLTLKLAVGREPVLSFGGPQFLLSVPSLVWPEDGALINSNQPGFQWELPEDDGKEALSYQVEVGPSPDFPEEGKRTATLGEAGQTLGFSLEEGEYFWRVRIVDGEREGDWSATWRFIVDLSPPKTVILEKPEPKTVKTWAKLAWSGEDNLSRGLEFSFCLDQEGWSNFDGQKEVFFDDLVEGDHIFRVRARDEAGNLGGETGFSWRVERLPLCLAADFSGAGEEDESQRSLVLEIVPQKEQAAELEARGSGEEPAGTVPGFSSDREEREVLGETTAVGVESGDSFSADDEEAGSGEQAWFLVLKTAALSSFLVVVGYFTARLNQS